MGFGNIVGPIISSGISTAAGLVGDAQNRQFTRAMTKDQQHFIREMRKSEIQTRVNDARLAGLHPLFALGGPTTNAGVIPVSGDVSAGLRQAGQDIGNAVARTLDPVTRANRELTNKLLAAQVEETDARKNYYNSMAAKERTPGQPGLGVQSEIPEGRVTIGKLKEVGRGPAVGMIDVQPVEQKSKKTGDEGVVAGEHAAYREYILPGGQPILLPDSDEGVSEVMENVPWYMWPGIIMMNEKHYGSPWAREFRDYALFGEKSKYGYPKTKDIKKNQYYKNPK